MLLVSSLWTCNDAAYENVKTPRELDSLLQARNSVFSAYKKGDKLYETKMLISVSDSAVLFSRKDQTWKYKRQGSVVYIPSQDLVTEGEINPHYFVKGDNYITIGPLTFYKGIVRTGADTLRTYIIQQGDTRTVLIKKGLPERVVPQIPRIGEVIKY